ncbi:MAG: RtcB family protein [Candidatus Thermoplasmatota archaeon]|nr:RtcB family protein [Candidatus Thermoplasmatota archaeon]
MWQGPIEKMDAHRFRIPKSYRKDMNMDGLLFTSEGMLPTILQDEACEQVANVATLPGLAGPSMAMPDVHWGYGFPIGGVAATLYDEGGVVSPGGVGFDINCGVRLLSTSLTQEEVLPKVKELTDELFLNVPSGIGSKARIRVGARELDEILATGAKWAVSQGYGYERDLTRMEEGGGMEDADPDQVSSKAKSRGMPQVGSLGAGNHFLEIQRVESIYDTDTARIMGVREIGQIMVMIHTGSRGLGYQVCQDQVRGLEDLYHGKDRSYHSERFGITIPDRQLVAAPLGSREADSYLGAMRSAANYAWANRQLITHWTRGSFMNVLGGDHPDMDIELVYDIAHNIAKVEEHDIEGRRREVCVHRKGATRAFGPGRPEIPSEYGDVGQPVLIPGDMGTASYLLVGTETAMRTTFGSTCHGAGRVMSRSMAIKSFRPQKVIDMLSSKGIYVRANSPKVISEEAPDAYKDIDAVIEVAHGSGLSKKVAKMVPIAVVKG